MLALGGKLAAVGGAKNSNIARSGSRPIENPTQCVPKPLRLQPIVVVFGRFQRQFRHQRASKHGADGKPAECLGPRAGCAVMGCIAPHELWSETGEFLDVGAAVDGIVGIDRGSPAEGRGDLGHKRAPSGWGQCCVVGLPQQRRETGGTIGHRCGSVGAAEFDI